MKRDVKAGLLPSLESPLRQLGQHLRAARHARAWTIAEAAARVVTSTGTYKRLEAGDPSVSIGTLASALMQMQLLESVVAAAAPAADQLGESLRAGNAVKRVRKSKVKDDARYDF